MIEHSDVAELVRLRLDMGPHIYRDLGVSAGKKLKRVDIALASDH